LAANQFFYSDSSITGGECYRYTITSYNVLGGESDYSNLLSVIPIKEPSGMTAPEEVTHDQTSVTLKWIAPTSDGASPVLKYIIYHKADY
jgi:hypothetical protein